MASPSLDFEVWPNDISRIPELFET